MPQGLLLIAALTLVASAESNVQSSNGEFIFSQYPARAKAAGEQGAVRFKVQVDAEGNVMSCRVTKGSGHAQLDRETCDLIVEHASFKPTLDGKGIAREAIHDGVVNWRLPGRTVAAKVALGGKSPDEIVCKRSVKTGSLVAHSRLCMTRREWVQYVENNQREWNEQNKRGFTDSVCVVNPTEPNILTC